MSWNLCRAIGEIHTKALGLTPLRIPGVPFDPPTDHTKWFAYDFLSGDSWGPLYNGSPRYYSGTFQVTAFIPPGKGIAALTQAVDTIVAHFDRQRLTNGTVTLDTAVPVPGPINTETDWISCPVSIPFETR